VRIAARDGDRLSEIRHVSRTVIGAPDGSANTTVPAIEDVVMYGTTDSAKN